MIARPPAPLPAAIALALGAGAGTVWSADRETPQRTAYEERQLVDRGLVQIRLDPKSQVSAGVCDELAAADLVVTLGGKPARVTAVERVPRPERHWLMIDISESAEGRRAEAKRSAGEYIREVLTPGLDRAALLTVDDDAILVTGPTADPVDLGARVEDVRAGGASALRDALDLALRQVAGDRHEHLFLFWTDGHDNESLATQSDLLETLAHAPNATIFPIALLPSRMPRSGEPPVGAFVFEVAKRSGGEVFASSDPRWLDRVRGWIARRFTVAFAPGSPGDVGELRIEMRDRRCAVTLLRDPFARPEALAGAALPIPTGWSSLHAKQRKNDDDACAASPGSTPWEWPLRDEAGALTGCVFDLVQTPGPLVRGRGGGGDLTLASARVAVRNVRVAAPAFAALPETLDAAIELLLPVEGAGPLERSPWILEGASLLAQRSRIATALFASRSEYRAFALRRLERLAGEELASAERDFARAFPDLPPAEIRAIARASRAGRRALDAIETPSDADLAGVLAAWHGDLPARQLFDRYERRLIDARIRDGADPDAEARWVSLRAPFAQPVSIRIAAPLLLVRDPSSDLVGFWRVVLPRPAGYAQRTARPADAEPREREEDRIPHRPLGLAVVDLIAADEETRAHLAARGYHVTRVTHARREPLWKVRPDRPFSRVTTEVDLESAGDPAARVVLTADLDAPAEGPVVVSRLSAAIVGDTTLTRLIESLGDTLISGVPGKP